jgi:hypothetical protein
MKVNLNDGKERQSTVVIKIDGVLLRRDKCYIFHPPQTMHGEYQPNIPYLTLALHNVQFLVRLYAKEAVDPCWLLELI